MSKAREKRKYKNPPIEEALVEFHFEPGQSWDLTIIGKFQMHKAVAKQYSGKPKQINVANIELQIKDQSNPNVTLREGLGKVRLSNSNGTRLVSLGTDTLAVHMMRPYSNWEEFKPQIETALKAYSNVAKPKGVKRIGVRYINKIILPSSTGILNEYFTYLPPHVEGLPEILNGFVSRIEKQYDDKIKLILMQANVKAPENRAAVLLDIDVIQEERQELNIKDIMQSVDDLHRREGLIFEATITEKTRSLFNAS